jgi:hypothetical protein
VKKYIMDITSKIRIFIWGSIIIMTFVTGCALVSQMPQKIELDDSARYNIKKIALLQVVPSQQVSIRYKYLRGPYALGTGFLPALTNALDDVSEQAAQQTSFKQTQKYVEELNRRGLTFVPELITTIQRELTKHGYEDVYLLNQLPKLTETKELDYSAIATGADAILHLFYGPVGYLSPTQTYSYSPWVVMAARLLDARTKRVLYFMTFNVTPEAGKIRDKNVTAIHPDKGFIYKSFDELMSKFDKSVEGILAGQEKIAINMAQQLSKQRK